VGLLEGVANSAQTALTYRFEDLFILGQGVLFAKNRSIPELCVVALRHPVECKGGVLPQGRKGTVVHVYRDGEHYEVEFAEPFPCTITLRRDDIDPE
jgi:hypothetical protein